MDPCPPSRPVLKASTPLTLLTIHLWQMYWTSNPCRNLVKAVCELRLRVICEWCQCVSHESNVIISAFDISDTAVSSLPTMMWRKQTPPRLVVLGNYKKCCILLACSRKCFVIFDRRPPFHNIILIKYRKFTAVLCGSHFFFLNYIYCPCSFTHVQPQGLSFNFFGYCVTHSFFLSPTQRAALSFRLTVHSSSRYYFSMF